MPDHNQLQHDPDIGKVVCTEQHIGDARQGDSTMLLPDLVSANDQHLSISKSRLHYVDRPITCAQCWDWGPARVCSNLHG